MKKYIFILVLVLLFVMCGTIGYMLYRLVPQKSFFKNGPLVSVVMPVYNREDLVGRAIESILSQTYPNFEFIIIDDGSTDKTMEIVQSYAQKDNRIVVLKNEMNKGIPTTRNRGHAAARGKYIAVMDSDDVALPERLEIQTWMMEQHPEWAFSTSRKWTLDDKPVRQRTYETIARYEPYFLFYHNLGHIELMFRRDFLEKNNIRYNEEFMASEDCDLLRQIFVAHGKAGYINKVLMKRRVHKTNSDEYYNAQRVYSVKTAFQFRRDMGFPKNLIASNHYCTVLKTAVDLNKTKRFLDQKRLEKIAAYECAKAARVEAKEKAQARDKNKKK